MEQSNITRKCKITRKHVKLLELEKNVEEEQDFKDVEARAAIARA